MNPIVAFDGSIFHAGPITGVAGSFLTTLEAYVRRTPFECVMLVAKNSEPPAIAGVRTVACLSRGRWGRLRSLRRACRKIGAALLHSPVTAVPGRNSCPTIATVHDLPWLYPELRGEPGSRLLRRMALHLAARSAAAVIVPSRSTLADVCRFVSIADQRVHVIYHGVVTPPDAAPESGLTGPFLVLGDDRPRKNLTRVRRAHAAAQRRDESLPRLRFVGPGHGYVEEAEKWEILRQSRALMHVSLLEGFGLPVLEALAHGVPVVCSATTSLPEIARDAALLVDPTDEGAIADAMVRIHQDGALRRTLAERGRERAREMTPATGAAAWLGLHEQLMSRPRPV
jgi:glycosyltransferase involved in cell wall biosynthesis